MKEYLDFIVSMTIIIGLLGYMYIYPNNIVSLGFMLSSIPVGDFLQKKIKSKGPHQ